MAREDETLRKRLRLMAEQELQGLFKAMPKEFKEWTAGYTIRFEDRPGRELIARGVKAETLCLTDRDTKEITVFLMNLRDRFGRFPGDVRQNFRKAVIQELADNAGLDVDLEEGV